MAACAAVSKRFDAVDAVRDASFAVAEGEFCTLLGPSGCGKTTLLRMIAGFEPPDSGDVRIAGRSCLDLPPHRRDIAMVFQGYALFPHRTVLANVMFGLRMRRRLPRTEMARQARETLAMVGLAGLEDRYPRQLSGGQQQRVALARAIVLRPAVLLLDEPLSALDLKLRKAMRYELKRLQHATGITTLYVTHDQEEALSMSDRIVVMNRGRIEQIGTPDAIYRRPRSAFVADFIGESNVVAAHVVERGREAARLRLDGLGVERTVAAARLPDALPADGRVALVVRAEHVRVVPPPAAAGEAAGSGAIVATVAERSFLGAATRLYLKPGTGGDTLMIADVSGGEAGFAVPGAPVAVQWDDENAVVVPQA
jgi:ABC-type Fe3+/spermidine/putrescine transport system ATPase subunit